MKTTRYFQLDVLAKRPYLARQLEAIESIALGPLREVEQANGRFRRWGWVGTELYRVVVLEDGETIHNAFPDPHAKGILSTCG